MTHISPSPSSDVSLMVPVLMGGPATLTDTQLVASLLQSPDLTRAENILVQAGDLNILAHAGPLELQAYGLDEAESVRAMLTLEWAGRVLAQRRSRRLPDSEQTIHELRIRGESWPRECVGVMAVDRTNTILVDRVLFQGTRGLCPVDVPELFREILRVGADAFVVFRWSPLEEAKVLPEDRILADKIRVQASGLGLTLIDVLIVAETSYWSCRIQDGWTTP